MLSLSRHLLCQDMSNKESVKLFRRNSEFFANKLNNSFTGGYEKGSLTLQQLLFEGRGDKGEGSSEEEGGRWDVVDVADVVYSDTDSSDDGHSDSCTSSAPDEKERQKKRDRVQEKLRVNQRRFAALFSGDPTAATTAAAVGQVTGAGEQGGRGKGHTNPRYANLEKRKQLACQSQHQPQGPRPQNALMPPSLLEEDFRHRSRGRIQHENYFGTEAKSNFVQRVQWVAREQSVLDPLPLDSKGAAGAGASSYTIFEDNTRENSHTIDFPFMPRRPAAPDDDVSVATEELEQEISAMDRANRGGEDSVSLLFCEDFFDHHPEDSTSQHQQQQQQQYSQAHSVAEDSYDTHSVATLDLSATMQFHKQTETTPRTRRDCCCY